MKHDMMRLTAVALVSLIGSVAIAEAQSAMSGGSSAAAAPATKLSKSDRSFATKAARAGLAEVAEAQIALQNSSNPDVKNFAQRMVDDHTKAGDRLSSIASAEGLKLPTNPSRADQKQAAALQKLSGSALDKRYISDQVTAHKEAVSLFTAESKSGQDAGLKDFAAQTLPTLQDHDRMVQSLATGKPMHTSSAQ
jgi:putative membrane protein